MFIQPLLPVFFHPTSIYSSVKSSYPHHTYTSQCWQNREREALSNPFIYLKRSAAKCEDLRMCKMLKLQAGDDAALPISGNVTKERNDYGRTLTNLDGEPLKSNPAICLKHSTANCEEILGFGTSKIQAGKGNDSEFRYCPGRIVIVSECSFN
jgi:hypothetical protein